MPQELLLIRWLFVEKYSPSSPSALALMAVVILFFKPTRFQNLVGLKIR